jgi:hypothetical protein
MTKDEIDKFEERFIRAANGAVLNIMFFGTKIGKVKPTSKEIDEMMEFLIRKERFEDCEYLKKYKENKNNSLSNVAQ